MKKENKKIFITEDEARAEGNWSKSKMANDRHLGQGLPYYKVGRRVLYKRAEILEYIERHRIDTTDSER